MRPSTIYKTLLIFLNNGEENPVKNGPTIWRFAETNKRRGKKQKCIFCYK